MSVSVDYATREISADAGADYTATSGTLTFAVGEQRKTVNVAVLEDAHDDDGETLDLVLSNAVGATIADGYGRGTIRNSDPMPKAWLGRFGPSVADQVLEGVRERREALRNPGERAASIGGHEVPLFGPSASLDGEGSVDDLFGAGGAKTAADGLLSVADTQVWPTHKASWDPFAQCGPRTDGDSRSEGFQPSTGGMSGGGGFQPSTGGMSGGGGFQSPAGGMSGSGGLQSPAGGMFGGEGFQPSMSAGYGSMHQDACGQQQSMTLSELLMGSSFAFTGKEDKAGGTLSAWGRMAESSFSGMEGALSVDGQLSTALAGVDYARPGWLASSCRIPMPTAATPMRWRAPASWARR